MPFFNAFNSSLSIPRLRRVVPFSGIPRQGRGRRLYCYGQSFDTNDTRSNNGFYWQVTSDHPDWSDATGMTTDIAITSFIYHPSSTTYQIGDTLNAVEFPGLNASSAYHVFGGTDQDPSSPLYAPNGYYISGFTKDAATYSTRWSIDFDSTRGNWVTFWTQIFNTPFAESSFLTNVEGSPLITLYDSNGYFYSWTLESIDYLGNVLQDKFWIRAFSSTYTPSFSISPSTTSINEGESVTFTVTGVDGFLDYSTLYYEVSSADDFTPETATGSFSFSNNTGSFIVTSVADLTSEGTETFTAGVKTNSGSSPVSYSNSVTILDTSVSPPTDPEIWLYGENDTPSNGTGNSFQDMVVDSQGFKWHNDGSSLYQMHSTNTIEQWTSRIFYDGQFEPKPYGSSSFPVGQFPGPQFDNSDSTFTLNAAGDAWCWNKDGSAFFVWVDYGGAADQKSYIDKYTLTSRFDISTASYTSRTEIEANTDSGRTVLNMNIDATDGSLLVITYSDLANDGLRKYTLSTPWDATTATLSQAETMTTGSRTVFGQTYYSWLSSGGAGYWDGTISACWWNHDGTQMFCLFGQSGSLTNATSRTFILTERFDLSTSLPIGNATSQTGVGNELPHPILVDESNDGAVHYGNGSDANGRTNGWTTDFRGAYQRPYNYSTSTYGTASLDFQGAQAKLAIPGLRLRNALTDHNFLEGTNFGISLWVKRTTLTDSLSNFIRLDGATTKLTLSINAFNKAQAAFRTYNSGSSGSSGNRTLYNTSQLPDADGYINDTNWHHVVFCRDNGTYRLYVDGVESASLASGTIVAQSFVSQDLAEVLEIGGQNLRIADVHISQTDALYTGGNTFTVPTSQPSLLAGGASTLLLEANELDWNDKTGNIDNISTLVPGNYGRTTDGTTVQQLITTNADMPYTQPGGSISWGGDRGLALGGYSTTWDNTVDYFDIATTGNATDFGDLTTAAARGATASDGSRILYMGGSVDSFTSTNAIEYFTSSTPGNSTDFGDLSQIWQFGAGVSDGTYGLIGGRGITLPSTNPIEYVTIATTGNSTDFGDLSQARDQLGAAGDATRGLFLGGGDNQSSRTRYDVIDYVTIATPGNATDFGNLSAAKESLDAASDTVRVVAVGGSTPTSLNVIEYVVTLTTGNATDFGDLTTGTGGLGATSNDTRLVATGGIQGFTRVNTMEYITIQTTSNATDFGDLTVARDSVEASSGSAA